MFPHTHITRDACFPSMIHVSPAQISLGMRVGLRDISKLAIFSSIGGMLYGPGALCD